MPKLTSLRIATFWNVSHSGPRHYLAHLYELPHQRELDEEGIIEETFDLFRDWA